MLHFDYWVIILLSSCFTIVSGTILASWNLIHPRGFLCKFRTVMSLFPTCDGFDPAKPLMKYCISHALADDIPLPTMDEYYFAHAAYTSVLRGRMNNNLIAVKIWRGAHMTVDTRQIFTEHLSRELDKWKRASVHRNVVPFLGVMSGFGYLPSLIIPLYPNGNMNQYLERNPQMNILSLLQNVADGLAFMHSLDPPVAHGSVRGANILITETGEAHLTDLCISTLPHSPDLTLIGGELECTRWMAPEIIDPPPELASEANYNTPAGDVYSFSMTILEAYTGRAPFAHRRFHAGVISDVTQGVRPPRPSSCDGLTDEIWDLIQQCWKQDPKDRPRMPLVCSWIRLLHLKQAQLSHVAERFRNTQLGDEGFGGV